MGSRTWIKLYVDKWLEGSLRQEKPALRGVWADLLALCGGGQYSQDGEIKIRKDIGFTDKMLALVLNITPNMWAICKKRLLETQRLSVNSSNILTIINWKNYQSEYERQKPQRTKSAGKSAGIEVDVRLKTIDDRSREESSSSSLEDNQVNKLSDEMAEIATIYEAEIGKITSFVAQELNDALQNYPADWIKDAIKEAVKQNKRKWSYVKGVLKNWKESGRQAGKDKSKRDYSQQKINYADPDKYIKGKYGHMVGR